MTEPTPTSSQSARPVADASGCPPARKTRSSPPSQRRTQQQRPGLASEALSSLSISPRELNTQAHMSPCDGRVHISLTAAKALRDVQLSRLLSGLAPTRASQDQTQSQTQGRTRATTAPHGNTRDEGDQPPAPPKLNIVIMAIGSRGDVQPFIAIAKVLREKCGHRVRLATHGAFREFVAGFGIEFFDVGGDPGELMAFMVKNPGLVPGIEAIKQGEIAKRREQMFDMFQSFWRTCTEPSDRCCRPRHSTDSQQPGASSSSSSTHHDEEPFIADAIVANPPSFAHVHCAEKLGCPLHLMFTFPYTPTQHLAHPLANIQSSNLGREYTNAISYPLVESVIWQGLGDLVNKFREETLGLAPVATLWAPGMVSRLKVPVSYMWSPALIPKPADWGPHIDVTGFVFLDQTKDYTPPCALQQFLAAGPPPIYIGFGSIIVDDPDALTATIFAAVKATGVRALVSKGWGGLGHGPSTQDAGANANEADDSNKRVPEGIFLLENTPHDWLFTQVAAVVHHGGAGTTAIGLLHGRPTMVVPFFGDQAFWGGTVHAAGAGPEPVPHRELTADRLAAGIRILLSAECRHAAQEISHHIREDDGDGAENAVRSFHRGIAEMVARGRRGLGERGRTYHEGGPRGPGEGKWDTGGPGIRCDVLPERVAVWRVCRTRMRLSPLAGSWLVQHGLLDWKDLRLLRHTEWSDFDGPGEPLSGGFSAFFGSLAGVAHGIVGVPVALLRGAKRIGDEVDFVPATTRCQWRRRFHRRNHPSSPQNPDGHDDSEGDGDGDNNSSSHQQPQNSRTIPHDIAHGTKKSISRIARSSARAPMDVSLAVAQGFHNAPRLYGDEVRHPARITGFHSGMRAAGKELALGFYDGISGLVTQPYRGFRDGGFAGALKGAGRGVGGIFFKTQAGLAAAVGFPLKGVHREIHKGRDRRVLEHVMAERRRQGDRELGRYRAETQPEAAKAASDATGDGFTTAGRADVLDQRMQRGWQAVLEERQKRQTGREKTLGKEIAALVKRQKAGGTGGGKLRGEGAVPTTE